MTLEQQLLEELEKQQTKYENNLSEIVKNYQTTIQGMQTKYENSLKELCNSESDSEALEKLMSNQVVISNQLKELQSLLADLPELSTLSESISKMHESI